jgi:hypothetical protein
MPQLAGDAVSDARNIFQNQVRKLYFRQKIFSLSPYHDQPMQPC